MMNIHCDGQEGKYYMLDLFFPLVFWEVVDKDIKKIIQKVLNLPDVARSHVRNSVCMTSVTTIYKA